MSSFQFAEKKSYVKILLHKETEFKITLLTSISDISTYHLNTYVRKVQIIVRATRRVSRVDVTGSRGGGKGEFPPSPALGRNRNKTVSLKMFWMTTRPLEFSDLPMVLYMHIKISHYHITASANTCQWRRKVQKSVGSTVEDCFFLLLFSFLF